MLSLVMSHFIISTQIYYYLVHIILTGILTLQGGTLWSSKIILRWIMTMTPNLVVLGSQYGIQIYDWNGSVLIYDYDFLKNDIQVDEKQVQQIFFSFYHQIKKIAFVIKVRTLDKVYLDNRSFSEGNSSSWQLLYCCWSSHGRGK